MAKKDFSSVNTGRVYSAIAEATANPYDILQESNSRETPKTTGEQNTHKIHPGTQKQSFLSEAKTPGRKSQPKKTKLPRINMAFTPQSYEYIRTMSKVCGVTLTDFVNAVVKQHMENHREQYQKALDFKSSL